MKKIFLLLITVFLITQLQSQNSPKRELRGAWLATFFNIDWPSSGATTAQEQSTFIQRVTEHKQTGINAMFVQIRSQCDAMYPSTIEPWSRDLTGTQGLAPNPYYDPLDFMISETRKQGMEFHAWFNPYRALSSATTTSLAALSTSHIINQQPSWILDATTTSNGAVQKILNPGIPAVNDYVISVIMDVVRRYDVDGIHLDDYFYPNPSSTTYNDDAQFAANPRGIALKADWRRANIDSLVKRLGDSIRSVKPWIKYGFSPTGIWLSASGGNGGSATSTGALQHHKDLSANSRLWQQQSWVDYLIPQVYWHTGQTGSDYNVLIPWWNNNAFNRHMYIGMAAYKVGDAGNGLFTTDNRQIPNQVRLNRNQTNVTGSVYYNTTTMRNNLLGFRDSLRLFFYNKPALLPTMNWKTNLLAPAPTGLTLTLPNATTANLSWTRPTDGANEYEKVKRFAIYRSTTTQIDLTNSNNLLAITWNDATTFVDNTMDGTTTYFYTVTSLNRLQHESLASNTASNVVTPLTLQNFYVNKINERKAELNWTTTNEINVSHFEVQQAFSNGKFNLIEKLNATNKPSNTYKLLNEFTTNENEVFYRLKMIDNDGSYKYSNIVNLKLKNKENTLTIQNNFITNTSIIQFTLGSESKEVSYIIIDAAARILQTSKLALVNGKGSFGLNQMVKAGLYYVKIIDKNEVSTAPIFIK